MGRYIINIFLFVLLIANTNFAQSEPDSTENVQLSEETEIVQPTKSPWGAVLRSALLPGLGQIYNESYWKTPVVIGGLIYLGSVWINQNNLYKKWRDLYELNLDIEKYKANRDFYRDQRDEFAIYIVLAYMLNLVDAYVDAQLFDFDVSENPIDSAFLSIEYENKTIRVIYAQFNKL